MVSENILEFERKHSKNLVELNEWVEKIKNQELYELKPERNYEPDAFDKPVIIENSLLYKQTGKLWDCDPLYEKVNNCSFEEMSHLKVLACYLTKDELKDRLSFENYMLLETEVIIDKYLMHLEDRRTRARIAELRRELKKTEAKLKNPTVDDKVDEILSNMTKIAGL